MENKRQKSKWMRYILIVILIALLFVVKDIIFVLLFIAIGAVSLIHMRFTQGYFGFELCTFFTVLGAMKYGAIAGVIIGISSITLGMLIGGYIKRSIVVNILGFALIGLIASFFPLGSLFWVGLGLMVIYDIFAVPLFLGLGAPPIVVGSYFLTHLITNYFVFSRAAYFLGF